MKTKVTISQDGDRIFLRTPYKKGYVVWLLEELQSYDSSYYRYTHEWVLYSKKREHNPERVARWHKEYLFGFNVLSMIRKTAAAKHYYSLLKDLNDIEINPNLTY
jgi:hypothetical protein